MNKSPPVRVLHFVTGGFSGGATQVALQLVNAARASDRIESRSMPGASGR